MCGKGSEISWAGEPGKTALLEALGAKLQAHYKGCKKKSLPVAKNRVFCSCGDFFAFFVCLGFGDVFRFGFYYHVFRPSAL